MFDLTTDYPKAVASYDDEGLDAAIEWCVGHAADGDVVSVWTSLVSNLKNCTKLERFVNRYSDVEHVTGRGFSMPSPGPVLMAWPRMDGIGELLRFAPRIRALCVLTWDEDEIRPWVTAAQPEILGDGSAWDKLKDPLDPVVLEALKSVTLTINLNNTIKAGYEKDDVVGVLRALYESGVPMVKLCRVGHWRMVGRATTPPSWRSTSTTSTSVSDQRQAGGLVGVMSISSVRRQQPRELSERHSAAGVRQK